MNYPQTSTTDPYTFSLWPDAPASGEGETAAWAGTVGYAQSGLIGDSFDFGDLDATAAWGSSNTLPAATCGLQNVRTPARSICVELTSVIGH